MCLLLATGHPDPLTTLKWEPATGREITYQVHRSGLFGAGEENVTMKATEKVIGIGMDGAINLEDSSTVTSSVSRGLEPKVSTVPWPTTTWRLTRERNGALIGYADAGADIDWSIVHLDARPLFEMVYPNHLVRKGDTWTYERAVTDQNPFSHQKIEYKFEGTEKAGAWSCYKVSASVSGMVGTGGAGGKLTGSGTFWLFVDDGSVVKSDLKVRKPDLVPINLHETTMRQS